MSLSIFCYIVKKGATGLPLAYITQEEEALPALADDLGFRQPDMMSEMVR